MESEALQTLQKELLPLATVITPNIPEAEVLSGRKINSEDDMVNVAREIKNKYGCSVLLKGGHSEKEANDFLCYDNSEIWFRGS